MAELLGIHEGLHVLGESRIGAVVRLLGAILESTSTEVGRRRLCDVAVNSGEDTLQFLAALEQFGTPSLRPLVMVQAELGWGCLCWCGPDSTVVDA
jgi:hypothetical protein